jgi:hypothetical protein
MTIDQALHIIAFSFLLGTFLFFVLGRHRIVEARKLPYFMLRRERVAQGWRILLLGFALGVASLLTFTLGPRAAYVIYPPTPSITPTFTQTPTATITPVPSITPTASVTPIPSSTPTATITPTPQLPSEILVLLRETVTPNPEAVFSPILVAARIDRSSQAINPQEEFIAPQGRLFGAFSYNNLQDGVRWTAIWYYEDEIVCFESKPWDGGTGGYGFTDCELELWLPGRYEIQLFIADQWEGSTYFEVFEIESTAE